MAKEKSCVAKARSEVLTGQTEKLKKKLLWRNFEMDLASLCQSTMDRSISVN